MVVHTKQAKAAATPAAQKQLREIASQLLTIPGNRREERLRRLKSLKQQGLHPDTDNFLRLTSQREIEHFQLMERLILLLPELDFVDRKPHDYSKDELFYFVAASYFDGGIQGPEMKAFVDEELKRHYVMEPHHPEYELYHDHECPRVAVMEMSVDRLARNVQFGDGVIDMATMEKFKPNFSKGDNEAKRHLFWECVLKYRDIVQSTFYSMYPEAREWASTGSKTKSGSNTIACCCLPAPPESSTQKLITVR